jgi:hypothetical protein
VAKEEQSPYRVDRLAEVDSQIRALVAKAATLGNRRQVIDALKAVYERLETDPFGWGDPEYRTQKEGGCVCHGIRAPLVVHYAVFEPERVVVILKIKPLPGSELK